jgi:hypothetical protein
VAMTLLRRSQSKVCDMGICDVKGVWVPRVDYLAVSHPAEANRLLPRSSAARANAGKGGTKLKIPQSSIRKIFEFMSRKQLVLFGWVGGKGGVFRRRGGAVTLLCTLCFARITLLNKTADDSDIWRPGNGGGGRGVSGGAAGE